MSRNPVLQKRSDWASDDLLWQGLFEGKNIGTDVTVLSFATDEILTIRTGRALFTVGDNKIEAEAGQILRGPAKVPHKYINRGPERLETTDIHVSDRWTQTDLDDVEIFTCG